MRSLAGSSSFDYTCEGGSYPKLKIISKNVLFVFIKRCLEHRASRDMEEKR